MLESRLSLTMFATTCTASEHVVKDLPICQPRGNVYSAMVSLRCSVEWDDPHGGVCDDTFELSDGGQTLTQATKMKMLTGDYINYK